MKFRVPFNELKEAVIALSRAVKRDKAMEPQLQLVRLKAVSSEDSLYISTNREVGVEIKIPAVVDEDGEFLTGYSSIAIVTVRDCSGSVTAKEEGNTLVLRYKGDNVKTVLPMSAVQFNDVPGPGEEALFVSLPLEKLQELYGAAAFVADDAPEGLHIIHARFEEDADDSIMKVVMTACDGKSVAQISSYCLRKGDVKASSVSLPPDRVRMILDILKNKEKDAYVTLSFGKGKIFASMENVRIAFPEFAGNIPDVSGILAKRKGMPFTAEVSRRDFIDALKCVIYLNTGSVILSFGEDSVTVGCPGLTEYSEKLNASINGEIDVTLFDANLLKNIAEKIPGDTLHIIGETNRSPFFVTFGEHDEYVYCALPRVQR